MRGFKFIIFIVLVLGVAACVSEAPERLTNGELQSLRAPLSSYERALAQERTGAQFLNSVHLGSGAWPEWQIVRAEHDRAIDFGRADIGREEIEVIFDPAFRPALKLTAHRTLRDGKVSRAGVMLTLSTNTLRLPPSCPRQRSIFEYIEFEPRLRGSKKQALSIADRIFSSISAEQLAETYPVVVSDVVFLDGSSISLAFAKDGELYELYRGPEKDDLAEGYSMVGDLILIAADAFPGYAEYLIALDRDFQTHGDDDQARFVMRNFQISEDQCLT